MPGTEAHVCIMLLVSPKLPARRGEPLSDDMQQDKASMPRKCLNQEMAKAAAHLAHSSTDAMRQAPCLSGENLASQQESGGIGAELDKERGQVIDELQGSIGQMKLVYA